VVNRQRKARTDGLDGYLVQVVLGTHPLTLGRIRGEIRSRHACLIECSANSRSASVFVPSKLRASADPDETEPAGRSRKAWVKFRL
jgi:hypothetical protein